MAQEPSFFYMFPVSYSSAIAAGGCEANNNYDVKAPEREITKIRCYIFSGMQWGNVFYV